MFEQFMIHHPILGPLGFIAARSIAVLIPWLPAFTIDVPGLLAFGLFPGFFYAELGIIIGASLSFWIARLFKHEILHFFPSLAGTRSSHAWSERQAFFAVLAMRISALPFFDYVAGFLNISFLHFFIATVIGSIPPTLFFYYFGMKAFGLGNWYGITFVAATILTALGAWIFGRKKDKKTSLEEKKGL